MVKKFIYFLLIIITFINSPLSAVADGGVIRPLPDGDWVWVDENSQQAFINYNQETEKLVVAVDIEEGNSDIVWIIPVPSKSEKVGIDITSELPIFFGDDVNSKAKLKFSESLKISYSIGVLGQIWTFPFSIFFVSLSGARGGPSGEMVSGDLVSVETHIEKAGMIAEVITAQNSQAIYNYFSQKGFDIKQGSISELNPYIEKDYSFVVSWIAPGVVSGESKGQRGVFVSFPTAKIYYPLILTSAYGETEIPITIRVLDHVKPEIFSEIKPYTNVSYFTERTKGYSGARGARCIAGMSQLRTVMELYHNKQMRYPFSLQELENDREWGEETGALLEDITKNCYYPPLYHSKNSNDYIIRLRLSSGLYEVNSSGFAGFIDEKNSDEEEIISPELQKFYGNKRPWAGEAEYTKITINAPANLLKKDLWMEKGRPLKTSFALFIANNLPIVVLFLYLLIVGIVSFIAGGLAGWLCFHKFRKYALSGLGNIPTLIGLILIFNYVRKKRGEDIRYSKLSFEFLFSIIFIFLLTLLALPWILLGEGIDSWFLPVMVALVSGIVGGVMLLNNFFLNKISLKNRAIRVILTVILFIILTIGIFVLFLF